MYCQSISSQKFAHWFFHLFVICIYCLDFNCFVIFCQNMYYVQENVRAVSTLEASGFLKQKEEKNSYCKRHTTIPREDTKLLNALDEKSRKHWNREFSLDCSGVFQQPLAETEEEWWINFTCMKNTFYPANFRITKHRYWWLAC